MKRVCSEPYRIFFPLGISIGILGVSHWFFYWAGWIPKYSGFFHSAIQIQGYMSCFIFGFLMTALPRFSSTHAATFTEVFSMVTSILLNVLFLFMGKWIYSETCFIFSVLVFLKFALSRIQKRSEHVNPPVEFIWIPIALLHALCGSLILILVQKRYFPAGFLNIGEDMSRQGFVLAIVAGVGSFLTPRLIGRFQSLKSSCDVCDLKEIYKMRRKNLIFQLVLALVLFLSFFFDSKEANAFGSYLRTFVVSIALFKSKSLPKFPKVSDFYAWLLWISMWMILIGLWLTAIFPLYEKTVLHFTFLGGYSLMIFSVATMVVLTHSGNSEKLHQRLIILRIVAFAVAGSLILRISAVWFPFAFFEFLGAASVVWLIGAVAWLFFALSKILKFPADADDFEHTHEQIKREISNI